MRIGSIVIHCFSFEKMLAFWQAALGYVPREAPEEDWVVLCDPQRRGPNVSLRRVTQPIAPPGPLSRLHLDLYTFHQEDEVNRLLALGASQYPHDRRPGDDFVVLQDPDGNRFCVVQAAANS